MCAILIVCYPHMLGRSDFTLPRVFEFTVTPEQLTPLTNVTMDTSNATPNSDAGCVCGQLCFNIPITQDSVFELTTESFELRLTVPDELARSSHTTVYIQDDDGKLKLAYSECNHLHKNRMYKLYRQWSPTEIVNHNYVVNKIIICLSFQPLITRYETLNSR